KKTEELQRQLESEKVDLENELENSKQEHQKLLDSIKAEKESWIQKQEASFSQKLENLEAKIRELDKASTPTKRHALKQEVKALEPETILEPIEVGDLVRLKQSSQVGTVEKIEKDSAFVSVGALSMQVKLKNLSKMEKPKAKKKQQRTHRVDRIAPVSLELNIIGKRVAEALPIVDKYLDDCVLRNLNTCHIIHGVGTGQLRTAVHELLRKHKMVESFELASIAEGGAGATRVEFKK
ncbi:MAG TPA: Smr/MutS family protein, partial [Erysipelothrix sp.]|nr:Smr/MutS family protein [Erysipelothrix sp.]